MKVSFDFTDDISSFSRKSSYDKKGAAKLLKQGERPQKKRKSANKDISNQSDEISTAARKTPTNTSTELSTIQRNCLKELKTYRTEVN